MPFWQVTRRMQMDTIWSGKSLAFSHLINLSTGVRKVVSAISSWKNLGLARGTAIKPTGPSASYQSSSEMTLLRTHRLSLRMTSLMACSLCSIGALSRVMSTCLQLLRETVRHFRSIEPSCIIRHRRGLRNFPRPFHLRSPSLTSNLCSNSCLSQTSILPSWPKWAVVLI